MGSEKLGKMLLIIGGIIALSGLVVLLLGKVGFIGKLPGDILIHRDNVTLYFPIVSFLLLSLILTIVLNIIFRFLK